MNLNLLTNASFGYYDARGKMQPSLVDWNFTPGTWYSGVKNSIPAAQCDQDMPREIVTGWPLNTDGYLWQDVMVPELAEGHTQITFSLDEQQHHGINTAVITIYGRMVDGGWVQLWQRVGLADVPLNTIETRTVWHHSIYTIPVPSPWPMYRLEFFGRIDDGITPTEQDKCGWKATNLYLEVS